MRNAIFILLLSFITLTSFVSVNNKYKAAPVLQFETMSYDLGTLKEDEIKGATFKFTNTGNAPLIITEVEKSCGCTQPEWSMEPVMPGKTGEISIKFSAKGQPKGFFRKTFNVYSNIEQERKPILMIKGTIEKGKVAKK